MNSNEARFFSTLIVWSAITIIVVTMMFTHVVIDGPMEVLLPLLLLIAPLASTRYIWRGTAAETSRMDAEKSKRKTRVERIVANLDEDELAWKAVERKLSHWKNLAEQDLKKKIVGFLSRRGFSYETANEVFNRAWSSLDLLE